MQIMCTSLERVQEDVFSCDMVPTLILYQEIQGLVNFKKKIIIPALDFCREF